ncbi:uncharacterized protein LOC113316120 [Papaver somniferum]|uniref:uncharacterized protein LOC113316120 n=1 Tax=Papaver somniferum TaxID=3469 RepID=UPI000E6FF874|nr:uncharacterized protein LOC113316120 [Papaver somniferum]
MRSFASVVCVGEVNLGGEPQTTERLIRQQTQSDNIILDDKEYRQRVMVEKQRQTQLFSQQPCTQYIFGGCKARKNKAYNERKRPREHPKSNQCRKLKALNKYPRHVLQPRKHDGQLRKKIRQKWKEWILAVKLSQFKILIWFPRHECVCIQKHCMHL